MAGIGFTLRKLTEDQSFSGHLRAYLHGAMASSGPWVISILSLSGITLMAHRLGAKGSLTEFRLLLIYNFSLTLVLSGPLFVVATRYLADRLYIKKFREIPSLFIYTLGILFIFSFPVLGGFYAFVPNLPTLTKLSAFLNAYVILAVWLSSLFVSLLEDYKIVTWSYSLGGTLAIILAWFFIKPLGTAGLLFGFTGGFCLVFVILVAQIFKEYPYGFEKPKNFFGAFKVFWMLALGSFFFNAGSWVDKWFMWFSSQAERGKSGLPFYDLYDTSLFLSQLTVIPGMALFLVRVETDFFQKCQKFYGDIMKKATYQRIVDNQNDLIHQLERSGRNIFIIQGGISAACILLGPEIFQVFHLNYLQMGIFRLGTLGAFFQSQTLFILILLTYFDARKEPLWISLFFLLSNGLLTFVIQRYGFRFYGYGYFFSTLLTFGVAFYFLSKTVKALPYHAFIRNNQSVYQMVSWGNRKEGAPHCAHPIQK